MGFQVGSLTSDYSNWFGLARGSQLTLVIDFYMPQGGEPHKELLPFSPYKDKHKAQSEDLQTQLILASCLKLYFKENHFLISRATKVKIGMSTA